MYMLVGCVAGWRFVWSCDFGKQINKSPKKEIPTHFSQPLLQHQYTLDVTRHRYVHTMHSNNSRQRRSDSQVRQTHPNRCDCNSREQRRRWHSTTGRHDDCKTSRLARRRLDGLSPESCRRPSRRCVYHPVTPPLWPFMSLYF